ncbi:alpha/beta hydrolase [Haladaptatus sp. NG-SE-30]
MSRTPTRRRLLHTIGTAATIGLAGCSSLGGDKTTTDTEATGTGTTDAETTGGGTTSKKTTSTSETTGTGETSSETTESTTTGTAPPKGGDVQFSTSGGATVQGTLLGDGSCGVVFAHGAGFDRKSWLPQVRRLAEREYTCLTIDLNLDDRSTTPEYVLAAVRYLRKRVGVKKVMLVGASAGANAVVRANAQAKKGTIDGTLALSPGKSADAASQMHGWKLFIVSSGDDDRFVQTTKQMYQNAPKPKRQEIFGGSAHGQHVFESNPDMIRSAMNSLLVTVCGDR